MKKITRTLVWLVLFCGVSMLHLWSVGALYFCAFPEQPIFAKVLIGAYILLSLGCVLAMRCGIRALLFSLVFFVFVTAWFYTIQPKVDAVYPPELTMPHADIHGDILTFHDVRNCVYRTAADFDVHYETRTYDLSKLEHLDMLMNYWGMDRIAHVFLSFVFSDGQHLCVSIEIRPEVGEEYGMLNGIFKQYEIIYIWADERDLIGLRTNYKNEDVYVYRTTMTPENVRRLFLSMVAKTNQLYETPEFYDTLKQNCTNTITHHILDAGVMRVIPEWMGRLLTGGMDRSLYLAGGIDNSLPFEELREQARVNERAKAAGYSANFSQKIRTHIA